MPHELTPALKVSVTTVFLPHRSAPECQIYVWVEESRIENRGLVTIQLLERTCLMIESDGMRSEHKDRCYGSDGPVLNPGEYIVITEHFHARTTSGAVKHSYRLATERGESFTVETSSHFFDSPHPKTMH